MKEEIIMFRKEDLKKISEGKEIRKFNKEGNLTRYLCSEIEMEKIMCETNKCPKCLGELTFKEDDELFRYHCDKCHFWFEYYK